MSDRRGLFRFATYAMVGAVGTLAQYVILVVSVSMHWMTPVIASVIGAVVGALINYLLNARITFRSNAHSSALPKFAMTALLGAAMNGLLMKTLIDFFGMNYLVAQIISTVIVLGITYGINLVWTFRRDDTGLNTWKS
ncbi:MAG: GtrA family protein [Sulfuriferula sp.]